MKQIRCIERFGDESIVLVGKNSTLALYDKTDDRYLTPFIDGKWGIVNTAVSITGKDKTLYIYDFIKKKFIIFNIKTLYYDYKVVAYYDKEKDSYHIISLKDNISLTFDHVEVIKIEECNVISAIIFLVTDKNGKGIYQSTSNGLKCHCPTGSVKNVEWFQGGFAFDYYCYFVVTTIDDKKRYIFDKRISSEFDSVKKSGRFFICQSGNTAYVSNGAREVFNKKCEDLINTEHSSYCKFDTFIIKCDGKCGIIEREREDNYDYHGEENLLVPFEYDKIIFDPCNDEHNITAYYLHKGETVGLYSAFAENKIIEPSYKSITHIAGYVFLFTDFSGKKTLINIANPKIVVEGVDEIVSKRTIIYTKDGKFGYINPGNVIRNADLDDLDGIRFIYKANTSRFYEVRKGNNNGIMKDGRIIVPIKEGQFVDIFDNCAIFIIYDEKGTHVCAYDYVVTGGYRELYTIQNKYKVEYLGKNSNNQDLFEINGIIYIYNYHDFRENMMYSESEIESTLECEKVRKIGIWPSSVSDNKN